jgi:hypothetical protein
MICYHQHRHHHISALIDALSNFCDDLSFSAGQLETNRSPVPCCLVTYRHPPLVLPPNTWSEPEICQFPRFSTPLTPSSFYHPFYNNPLHQPPPLLSSFIFFRSSLIAHSWHSFCSMRITHLASLLAVLELA